VGAPCLTLPSRALTWARSARVSEGLGVSWNTANDAVLAEGRRVLIEDPHRFDGVRVIGVDEHCWRHTRRGDKYVTVIIDLTPIRDGTGPARLLDMVEGRSKQVFKAWLGARDTSWRDGVEVDAMGGFTGFKTATSEELPDAVAVMDPFHVVSLAGEAAQLVNSGQDQARMGRSEPIMVSTHSCRTPRSISPMPWLWKCSAGSSSDWAHRQGVKFAQTAGVGDSANLCGGWLLATDAGSGDGYRAGEWRVDELVAGVEVLVLPAVVAVDDVPDLDPVEVVEPGFRDGKADDHEPVRIAVRRRDH
jgi:hypothetical protein